MNDIIYTDIQTCIENNIDINNILNEVKKIMEIEYPEYVNWFNEKVIPGLYIKERNIILIFKKNILIGFVNLKKTKKERKMSNLYIMKNLFYNKYFNRLTNLSMEWLETKEPTLIISDNELDKYAGNILEKKWDATRIIKDKNSVYYVFNGNDEFNDIRKSLIKKSNKNVYNH